MRRKNKWVPLFLAPSCLLFLLIYLIPLIMVFSTSLMDYRLTGQSVRFVGLGNFVNLFRSPDFRTAFLNTILWILIHCILHVGIGVALALVLYKKPRGWKFVRTAYMIPNIISNAAMAMIFLNIFNPQFGVLNAILRALGLGRFACNWLMESNTAFISVTMTWFLFAGYTTILVLAQALALDPQIIEAAKVDGASPGQVDRLVVLPLLKKMVGATMIMAATYMLQLFDLIYITTQGGPGKLTTNLPLMLYGIYKSENNYGQANAVGVLIIVLGVICMSVINRVFGMTKDQEA